MKAMKFLSVVLLLVAASICVSSCNKDDDEIAETSIIGTWSQTYESGRYEITATRLLLYGEYSDSNPEQYTRQ